MAAVEAAENGLKNTNKSVATEGEKSRENKNKKQKKLLLAYLYWLVGGLAGLHHFYLGRLNQGFAWWTTGGGFVIGYLRDLWRMSDYVKEANLEPSFVKCLFLQAKHYKQPEFKGVRFLGMVSVAMFYGYLAQFAVPENCFSLRMNEHKVVWIVVVPLSIAFGNYLVGNIGYERVKFKWCLIGAMAPSLFLPLNPDMTSYCALFSTVMAYWKRSFRKSVAHRDASLKNLLKVIVGFAFYASLWASLMYYNVSVVTKEGERVYLRDVLADYFEDDFEFPTIFKKMSTDFFKFWRELRSQVHSFKIMEDTQSYMVLGLDWGASEEEVTAKFRELAKTYHPDKNRGLEPSKLAEYNARMVEITRAYEALTKKRKSKSKKSAAKSNGDHDRRNSFDILKDEL